MSEKMIGVVIVTWGETPDDLAPAMEKLGGYARVRVGSVERGVSHLQRAIDDVIAAGADRVILLPDLTASANGRVSDILEAEFMARQQAHPGLEFVNVSTPFDIEPYAHLLIDRLRPMEESGQAEEIIPLSSLSPHRRGTVRRLVGGHEFASRLSALGFIPGTPIQVVQNFGVGPLIVMVRDSRIALGRKEARKIRVRPSDGGGHADHGRHPHRRRWHESFE